MIDSALALQLKEAGLVWQPVLHDFFYLPDRLEERPFVISDLLVNLELLQGQQVISFQGAPEWALDYLVTTEAIWLPTETQLRERLEAVLLELGRPEVQLRLTLTGCHIRFSAGAESIAFSAPSAETAYALALLHLLRHRSK